MFPLLFLASRHRGLTLAALAATIIVTALGWNYRGFGQYMVCFMAGVALIRYGEPVARRVLSWPRTVRIALLAASWVAILSVERLLSPHTHMYPFTVLVFTLCATIIVTHSHLRSTDRRPFAQAAAMAGRGLLRGVSAALPGSDHARHDLCARCWSRFSLWDRVVRSLPIFLLAVAAFAVTLPLAAVSYRLLERPCQDIGRLIAERVAKRSPSHRESGTPVHTMREPAE